MDSLSRPSPPRSVGDRIRTWIGWFGLGRLVSSAIAVVTVCVGAYWLVRTPPPPTEALIPRASLSTSTTPTLNSPASSPSASGHSAPAAGVATTVATAVVVVHVAGAVAHPGVYRLPGGSRITAAIEAAGGALPDADADALNLAATVADGTRVYVPLLGEEAGALIVGPPSANGDEVVSMIDVNRATVDELESLPGVGPATATAIVTERERNGPFLVVDDLDRVPGIGPAKLEAIRDLVTT